VGFQNSATSLDLGFYAARSYSLMRPPRTGRRLIRVLVPEHQQLSILRAVPTEQQGSEAEYPAN
jgi:hypothetical protein